VSQLYNNNNNNNNNNKNEAEQGLNSLILEKSKGRYLKSHQTFKQWQDLNKVTTVNMKVLCWRIFMNW
jgi:hypothetical protein